MRINIINLDKDRWILSKFAKKLALNLKKLGHEVSISKKPKKNVDVNHYIIFLFQKDSKDSYCLNTINTTMLTHVNDEFRFNKVRSISKYMDAGITFSKNHMNFIKSKSLGLKKIFFVLPPSDNDLKVKKINFGFFTNLYNDGRKSQEIFCHTIQSLPKELVKISIIGKGWNSYVLKLKQMGYEVQYQKYFLRWRYIQKMNEIDYLIYLGNDEGSMSFLDALQLGVKTIMIPQGFQNDLKKFITFKLKQDLSNFKSILETIIKEKKKFIKINNKLTWSNYAKEHIKIWKNLM